MFLLVRLSLFISKESFTDGSKLIDIDGIVPEVVTVESPTNLPFLLTHPCRRLQNKLPSSNIFPALC